MKNIKGFTLGLVLGLSIAIAGIAYAQTNTQSDPNKKSDCCVAMDCCKGDSCPMMNEGATKDSAAKSDGHGCCCCGGDSCEMNHTKHKNETKNQP